MSLFQNIITQKHIASQSGKIKPAYELFAAYFHNAAIQENILASKEEQFQEGFLRELFVKILGYTLNPDPDYNLITERKNEKDAKKADGAIIIKGEVVGIIELKDHKTIDLKQIETQAFGYKNNNRKASYVITSNFEKLRFYIDNAIDFVEFNLFTLTQDGFALLWLCLAHENIAKDLPKQLKAESVNSENDITKKLYKDYSEFKRALFADLVANNPDYDQLTLFKKSQKLLDRLLFILFAEDCGLLPANSIAQIVEQWETLKDLDAYSPLYDRMKMYFGYMNTGHKGKKHDIFAYNGGLFKPDEVLDAVLISDEVLREHAVRISQYNFASEVDVNILGHIFENSLTEIEEITNELSLTRGHDPLPNKASSKRKKDGVFYTPRYITTYIVENTLGKLCTDKKAELQIDESEYFADKKRQIATKKRLDDKLQAYRTWLLQLTICDPACGSGAFLNAALDYLMSEHRLLDELTAKLLSHSIAFPDVENAILEHNLFGVDINEESVEIAKLALWLRTAKPHRKLNSLNNNIKCGNSLISDPEVAGDKAFDWHAEFPQVFKEKQKKAWHITTAVHDSRTSERMVEYKARELRDNGLRPDAQAIWLSEDEELLITKTIAEIVAQDILNVLAYNICGDHIHLLLVCEEEELSRIVQKIKSITAIAVNKTRELAPLSTTNVSPTGKLAPLPTTNVSPTGELAPLSKKTSTPFWTRKFGCKEIADEKQLWNTIEYIKNNRLKHELKNDSGACSTAIKSMLCSIDHAFRTEYKGGFDVVIGNPPYGAKIDKKQTAYLSQTYINWGISASLNDTYFVFYAMSISHILDNGGYLGFITPNTWKLIENAKPFRKVLLDSEYQINQIVQHTNKVFADATVDCDTLIVRKDPNKADIVIRFMDENAITREHSISQKLLGEQDYINLFLTQSDYDLKDKILAQSALVKDELVVKNGVKPYEKGKGKPAQTDLIMKEKPFTSEIKKDHTFSPLIGGSYFHKYLIIWNNNYWIQYGEWLAAPREKEIFEADEKLIFRQTGDSIIGTLINKGFIMRDNTHIILNKPNSNYNLKYVLSCLNSKLSNYFYWTINPEKGEAMAQIKAFHLGLLPTKSISPEAQQPFINLADKMLALNAELQGLRSKFLRRLQDNFEGVKITGALEKFDTLYFAAFVRELGKQKLPLSLKSQDEWEEYFTDSRTACQTITTEIATTDRTIDTLVYELYGLTEEEILIVEN